MQNWSLREPGYQGLWAVKTQMVNLWTNVGEAKWDIPKDPTCVNNAIPQRPTHWHKMSAQRYHAGRQPGGLFQTLETPGKIPPYYRRGQKLLDLPGTCWPLSHQILRRTRVDARKRHGEDKQKRLGGAPKYKETVSLLVGSLQGCWCSREGSQEQPSYTCRLSQSGQGYEKPS